MADNDQATTEIKRLLPEIEETRVQIKTLRNQLKDAVDQNDEYKKLAKEIEELASKRSEARKLLLSDRDYQKLNEELEEYRFKLRDLDEILSSYLLEYYNSTQRSEITDERGDTRPLIITARVGKSQ